MLVSRKLEAVKCIKEINTNLSIVRLVEQNDVALAIKYSTRELIKREVEIIKLLDFKGVPTILNFYEREIHFKKLKEFNSKLDLMDIRNYLKQLAEILVNIHDRGICHLDISPGNLMLDENDSLVLIDFQLARKQGESIPIGCGTPGYIAPEIFTGTKVGYPADIFSTAIVFGSLLAIYLPELKSLNSLGSPFVTKFTTDSICNAIDSLTNLSPLILMVADLLQKMMNSDPQKRLTAKEILCHPFMRASSQEFCGFSYHCFVQKSLIQVNVRSKSGIVLYRS